MLWGITGSGDKIVETAQSILRLRDQFDLDIRVALSKNGEKVARIYEVWNLLQSNFHDVLVEKGPKAKTATTRPE